MVSFSHFSNESINQQKLYVLFLANFCLHIAVIEESWIS
jgi:hypothetical protein